jgi:hypothetical protein
MISYNVKTNICGDTIKVLNLRLNIVVCVHMPPPSQNDTHILIIKKSRKILILTVNFSYYILSFAKESI